MPRHTPAEKKKNKALAKKRGITENLAARSRALAELGVPGTFARAEKLTGQPSKRDPRKRRRRGALRSFFGSPFNK